MDFALDTIYLRGMRAELSVGEDAWSRQEMPQPVVISLEVEPRPNIEAAASGDDVSRTLDYGKLYRSICGKLATGAFPNVGVLSKVVADCLPSNSGNYKIEVCIPKATLRGSVLYTTTFTASGTAQHPMLLETMTFDNIKCTCIVGVNPHERLQKQIVNVRLDLRRKLSKSNFELDLGAQNARGDPRFIHLADYQKISLLVAQRVEASAFQTVEALATAVAQTVTMDFGYDAVTVSIEKPNAISSIDAAGIRIRRRKSFFEKTDFWKVGNT